MSSEKSFVEVIQEPSASARRYEGGIAGEQVSTVRNASNPHRVPRPFNHRGLSRETRTNPRLTPHRCLGGLLVHRCQPRPRPRHGSKGSLVSFGRDPSSSLPISNPPAPKGRKIPKKRHKSPIFLLAQGGMSCLFFDGRDPGAWSPGFLRKMRCAHACV